MAEKEAMAEGFSPVERPARLSDEIARRIAERIASRALAPGDRLPTEAELCQAFGVSRAVVREAVARLRTDGLVETQRGVGAFVSHSPELSVFRLEAERASPAELRQIFELRTDVEAGAAALAAARCTETQMEAMRTALSAMAKAVSEGENGTAADVAFHIAIAEATDNPIYRDFLRFLAHRLEQAIGTARRNSATHQGWSERVQIEHEAIFEAIAARDPEAARTAAKAHIINAAHRLGIRSRT